MCISYGQKIFGSVSVYGRSEPAHGST